MNDIVKNLSKDAIQNFMNKLPVDAVDYEDEFYGTFTRDGEWTMGRDKEPIPADEYVVNILGLRAGWICWNGGDLMEEITVAQFGPHDVPLKEDLPDHGPYRADRDGWQEQRVIPLKGVDTGTEITIKKGNTYGMRKMYDRLCKAIGPRLTNDECWPVIVLTASGYDNKKTGSYVHTPGFTIVRWVSDPNAKAKKKAVEAPKKRGSIKDELSDEIPF